MSLSEFDLPDINPEDLPSLESILQEDDANEEAIYEELSSVLSDETKATDDGTYSIASEASIASNIDINDLLKPKKPNKHGSVLRHVILKKISSQLIDACNRRDAGLPTSIAVSNIIGIGTSHGVVLVFEPIDQVLKLVLGTVADGDKYGAVTALGINVDCSRLLVGFARGQITMWDLNNGNCLRVITDAHPVGYAVLHIQFTDDPTVAMLNDSSGSVYTLNFKRLITRTCESSCFFSGSKGEVCNMVPLHISPNLKDSPLYESSLLAMASLTKLIVVSLTPKPTAVFTQKLSGPQECLPLLSWYFAISETDNQKSIIPVLAFGRNQTILFYKVSKSNDVFLFDIYQTIKLKYVLTAMSWINSQVVVTIDTSERIRVIDVASKEELECLDIGSVQLVYGSSYFKSLATGGNVSKALKAASSYACYQSVQTYNGQLILLGTKSIHCLNVRHWTDRLDYLVKRDEHIDALILAKAFLAGEAKAVVGLTTNKKIRKSLVSNEIVNILLSYLDAGVTYKCPKTSDENVLKPFFRSLVTTAVDYCLLINDLDLLFGEIYERFSDDEIIKNEFLQGLEEYILDRKLVFLPPIVMQDFIEYFEKTAQLRKLEDCLVHLDLLSVDLNHLVKLCWAHHLYNLVIYIYNKGLKDYLTPVEKLIKILRNTIEEKDKNLDKEDIILGNKIFVYLSCSLAGNQFPVGLINEDIVDEVKSDLFNWIITKYSDQLLPSQTYPFLRTLLTFDTREFLNVLSIAFGDENFEPTNKKQAVGTSSKRQKMVDILLNVMMDDDTFSPSQVGCLFTFIARQMAKHEKSIQVNNLLFEQVLEYLTNPDEKGRHEEREQALLELLAADGLRHFPKEHVLALAESAKFYRVCEIIYQSKRQYAKVLSCYYRDSTRKVQAFSYINEMLMDDSITDFDTEDISNAVSECIFELAEINSIKLARLFINHFSDKISAVVKKLKPRAELQYTFLKGTFQYLNTDTKKKLNMDVETHEQYLELMCVYEPENVLTYLQENTEYRLEQALTIVRPYNLIHATSFLLERMGDIMGAFKILCNDLKAKVTELNDGYSEIPLRENEIGKHLVATSKALQISMRLCQRTSSHLESEDRQAIWFQLLETVMAPQRNIKDTQSDHFLVYKEFTKDILMNMMPFVSLPAVLQKIMQDPTYSSGKFGEIKELIFGMLETYNYELTLLETTNNLLGSDLYSQYAREKRILSQGFRPSSSTCCLCSRSFTDQSGSRSENNDIVLFRCTHAFHSQCLQSAVGFDEELTCVLCNKNSVIHTAGYRRLSTRSFETTGNSKSTKNNKKSATPAVFLSDQQQAALNVLWNQETKNSSMLSTLTNTSSPYKYRPTGQMYKRQTSNYFDEFCALQLAPPNF